MFALRGNKAAWEWLTVVVAGSALLLCYHGLYGGFFPNAQGSVGGDYSYFLPNLLDGYFWQHNNGLFTPQWFSPAFCGGVPAFFNPQNIYYSLPQWLTFFVNPLTAVYLTLLTFAALGFAGSYWLLRHGFATSCLVALFGATLFLFNGFFSHRMIAGHLTFHAFMLIPLIAACLLRPVAGQAVTRWPAMITNIAVAGLLFAYMVYSGMINGVLPALLALTIIGLIHGLMFGHSWRFWLQFALAGVVGMALAAGKIVGSLAFLENFQRSDYALPGANGLWALLRMGFEMLFLTPSSDTVSARLQWALERHEFEYGITLVPFVVMLIGIAYAVTHWRSLTLARGLTLALIGVLCCLPLALNVYTPGWNATLKTLPIIGSSSNLLRWFSVYISVAMLAAALALQHTRWLNRFRPHVAVVALVGVLIISVNVDRQDYAQQSYDPAPITSAYRQTHAPEWAPSIRFVTAFRDEQGRILMPNYRNNTLIQAASQLTCYEPVFGYRLEHFPLKTLHPAPVDQITDNHYNIKNPACYVYPVENRCEPGDHYSVDQSAEAKAFVLYQPIRFAAPLKQHLANGVSVISAIAIACWIVGVLLVNTARVGTRFRRNR